MRLTLPFRAVALISLIGWSSASVAAQVWAEKGDLDGRSGFGSAYDPLRGRVVLFGGDRGGAPFPTDTWEYDGRTWTELFPATTPTARGPLAFDGTRGSVITFGGTGVPTGTWAWDGADWELVNSTNDPPPRLRLAMVRDVARGRIVLFGGALNGQPFGDTWEWDGTDWTQRTPAVSPPARWGHAMTYDVARHRVLLHGGMVPGSALDDTWQWDGTNWSQLQPARRPPPMENHALAYDEGRRRTVLFGGLMGATALGETWELVGSGWQRRFPTVSPRARYGHGLLYDAQRGELVAFLGTSGSIESDTWRWDGTSWTEVAIEGPGWQRDHDMVYDDRRDDVVLFGPGLGWFAETWLWDSFSWRRLQPAVTPSPRDGHAMAWDSVRGRAVLFGGEGPPSPVLRPVYGDTWEWDGSVWTQVTTPVSPGLRRGHALAYDSGRQRTVMFGGFSTSFHTDTWEYDGATSSWTRVATTGPSSALDAAMAYDPDRGRIVLFGGIPAGAFPTNETWEWDGTTWTRLFPAVSPSRRVGAAFAWHPGLRRTVLVGGNYFGSLGDAWQWDGVSWSPLPRAPSVRSYAGMASDTKRDRVVLYGSADSIGHPVDDHCWVFSAEAPAARVSLGPGCGGVNGAPPLRAFGPPRTGNPSFALDVFGAPPALPGAIMLGTVATTLPLGGSCVLRIQPGLVLASVPLVTSAQGAASIPVPLPPRGTLGGVILHMQGVVLDPQSPIPQFGVSLTEGIAVTFGQ